ncbi:MAG: hypothetical protein WD049_10305 [Candidatus Paceibacterota bacterium]
MFNIQEYLKKFRALSSTEGEVKDATVAVIEAKIGTVLSPSEVVYRGKQVFITAHPAVKNEIMLRRREVVAAIQAKTSLVVRDIR